MSKFFAPFFGVTMVGCLVACANAQDYNHDTSVYQFLEAERQKSNPNAMYGYEQSMQGSLFAMYPTYWRLNNDIASLDATTVNAFVSQYPSQVISEKLAADYAETKARQSDYPNVRAVAGSIENADSSEQCAIALGYNSVGDSRALAQKDNVWLNTQIKQSLCDKLALEMVNNPSINHADRHEQLVRMMRIDKRQLSSKSASLDKSSDIISLASRLGLPIDYATLSTIRVNPNQFFGQFGYQPYSQANQYLYIYAISLVAHRSYPEAVMQLQYDIAQDNSRPQKLLSDMARRYAWRSIAVKRMNMNTDDGFNIEAVEWFRNSLGEPFNFEEAEDYALASIYFSQWNDVITAIGQMDAKKSGENTWQYWLARAYEQTGKSGGAKRIYKNLTKDTDYYGLLARDRLGQTLSVGDIGANMPSISQHDATRVMQNPHFARAFKLMENGAAMEHIQREWNWAVRKTNQAGDSALLLAAAKRVHDMGVYSRSIHALENSPKLRVAAISHPMPFLHNVRTHSQNAGIDPAWAYGIMRQESRFVTNAKSGAGAGGLMQIIPGTATQIARGMGESVGSMSNPDTNIRYGTWFLGDLYRKMGNIAVATASYNAGPNAAKKWLPKHGSMDADQYVETIPYFETRDYVKHVMENATIYGILLGQSVPISQRMGMVSPIW